MVTPPFYSDRSVPIFSSATASRRPGAGSLLRTLLLLIEELYDGILRGGDRLAVYLLDYVTAGDIVAVDVTLQDQQLNDHIVDIRLLAITLGNI